MKIRNLFDRPNFFLRIQFVDCVCLAMTGTLHQRFIFELGGFKTLRNTSKDFRGRYVLRQL